MTKLDILMLILVFLLILTIGSIIFDKLEEEEPEEEIEQENPEIETPLLPYEENNQSQMAMSGM